MTERDPTTDHWNSSVTPHPDIPERFWGTNEAELINKARMGDNDAVWGSLRLVSTQSI